MRKFDRIILIVLDSLGVGAMPDAHEYGDAGVNTLGHLRQNIPEFSLPNLTEMGLFHVLDKTEGPACGAYGKMHEASIGKDTTVGHWELMGCIKEEPFPVYPDGFPDDLVKAFEKAIGRQVIGNRPASGTVIISELGDEHVSTGKPIIYTSADSVFQIAAHTGIIPLETLYSYCRTARKMLQGRHGVARVIARPFSGISGNYKRTHERHDYSLEPFCTTALDVLSSCNVPVTGIGKIWDIYAGKGISHTISSGSNRSGMVQLLTCLNRIRKGLVFINLVDFDMKFGHRRDPAGYYEALTEFDRFLPVLKAKMYPSDALIITADHGCDPYHTGTDHTREYVPVLLYGTYIKKGISVGTRRSFADLGSTILSMMSLLPRSFPGLSFADMVLM